MLANAFTNINKYLKYLWKHHCCINKMHSVGVIYNNIKYYFQPFKKYCINDRLFHSSLFIWSWASLPTWITLVMKKKLSHREKTSK